MEEISELIQNRLDKLNKLKTLQINPYPYAFQVTHTAKVLLQCGEELITKESEVAVAGRVMALRGQGKAAFAHLQDDHERIQIYVRMDVVGESLFEIFGLVDIGDYLGVQGVMMKTKTGELTVRVKQLSILSKSIRPLPVTKIKEVDGKQVAFDEVTDKEFRYRQRYVDLTLNEKVAAVFRQRALVIQAIRNYLLGQEFLEVETPTLQPLYGGAHATPFKTHHKALGFDFFLRISNELYLKRLIVGGFNRVFEFVRNFRNEGIDRTHNPEFTCLEFYQAYADYSDMMSHCENIWKQCALAIHGKTEFDFQGTLINVKAPWRRLTMQQAILEYAKLDFNAMSDADLKNLIQRENWKLEGEFSRGRVMQLIFEELCEKQLIQPTFITEYPRESTPLCKASRENPLLVERFEAYVNGWEISNSYSELNDPVLQRALLEEQVERGRGGEAETQPYDEDFIRAMEYGMPPMGGIGFGIDRMIMLLTNQVNIRDVIFFPTMRPE